MLIFPLNRWYSEAMKSIRGKRGGGREREALLLLFNFFSPLPLLSSFLATACYTRARFSPTSVEGKERAPAPRSSAPAPGEKRVEGDRESREGASGGVGEKRK